MHTVGQTVHCTALRNAFLLVLFWGGFKLIVWLLGLSASERQPAITQPFIYRLIHAHTLVFYLFICSFGGSSTHSLTHSHIHSLNHIPYLEIAHWLLYSVRPSLQSLCWSSHLLHLTLRSSQALLKHPPSSSPRAQQTQDEFTESNRRFILRDCLWAPPWGVSRVCHSFNFQIWARGAYAFGTDNGYQTEKWRAIPHVDS